MIVLQHRCVSVSVVDMMILIKSLTLVFVLHYVSQTLHNVKCVYKCCKHIIKSVFVNDKTY